MSGQRVKRETLDAYEKRPHRSALARNVAFIVSSENRSIEYCGKSKNRIAERQDWVAVVTIWREGKTYGPPSRYPLAANSVDRKIATCS